MGYEALAARNPGLVYCSISAYGHTGPDAHRAGFGLNAEAKSGIMQMVGNPGETPPLLRVSLGDLYTGIHAVAAINAALLARFRGGKGQHIDMALYDTLVSMHEYAIQCFTLSGGTELPVQTGRDMPNSTLYGVFRTRAGDVVIAAQVDDAWRRFAAVVEAHGGPAGFAADSRFHASTGRNAHRQQILDVVNPWVAGFDAAALLDLLDRHGIPCAKVQRIDEVLADPQIKSRGMVVEQQHPVLGPIQLPNLPFRFSGFDTTIHDVAPDLGQHNADIAAALGYSAAEITALQDDGVLYAPRPATGASS
jgi:crotonobetainyl-CoA:carnitine CoA-transferase CaiB-like acyl-CoA transferase